MEETLHAQLRAAWQAARRGQGQIIHIEGGVGSGKSAVLARFQEAVGKPTEGVTVVSARCAERDGAAASERTVVEELVLRVADGVRAIQPPPPSEKGGPAAEQPVPWLLPGVDFVSAAAEIAALPRARSGPEPPGRAAIHAGLLLDVARERPVLLILDDAHRADPRSRRLIETLADGLVAEPRAHLLLVMTTSAPMGDALRPAGKPWRPAGDVVPVPAVSDDQLTLLIRRRLAAFGEPEPEWLAAVVDTARGNPLVAEALVQISERAGAFRRGTGAPVGDVDLRARPAFAGLNRLAKGELPDLAAHVRADLQAAAVVGRRFETSLMAQLWSVPEEAALIRIDALRATGLVAQAGDRWAFRSAELSAHYADSLPGPEREALHVRIGTLLRGEARTMATGPRQGPRPFLDVTETWSETRRRDRRVKAELSTLEAAAAHFAGAGRHAAAAEAGVTLVERLFETSGGHPHLNGRFGRRADRERRHRIYAVLTEAGAQLQRAHATRAELGTDPELMAIHVRLATVRSRFKEVLGDFAEARHHCDSAVELAAHLPDPRVQLEAMRVRLEVCYAAGDANAARQGTVGLIEALERAPKSEAIRTYAWLAEALGRWEWFGLHHRLFPYIIEQLQQRGAAREALRAHLEWLAAALEAGEHDGAAALVEEVVTAARGADQVPYLSEQLARYAAELTQSRVDAHFDLLSGEFYPPDLFGTEQGPTSIGLAERLQRPLELMETAQNLVGETDSRVSLLRVMTTALGVIYETRERFADLLDRWVPVHGGERPVRLLELVDALERGPFSVERVEALTERTVMLARELELDQVIADTLYEALDRDLPGIVRRSDSLFPMAREAYTRVRDTYGLITLSLVRVRHTERHGGDASEAIAEGLSRLESGAEQLTPEQRAFVHLRYGELFLDRAGQIEQAIGHLEQAIRLYDQIGDMEHVQTVGDILRALYRKQGDLGRYRSLRERFRALEIGTPGTDPLGLEMRIEHLLTVARQETNDDKAIAMVEQCVQLFSRVPDGTTRIDECFVEISKICRRRADESQTEAGLSDWLRRSLEAVRIAAQINRGLGNFHRVFEEYHELFDDLLGLGAFDEYVRTRAESRELAFAVGNVAELLYLFEEHLHFDAETGNRLVRLPEVRGFYEALVRYLLGLGAIEHALRVQTGFVEFLTEVGETELAEHYRQRALTR